MTPDWDSYFMSLVYLVASKSKDEYTHLGAVIVGPGHELVSTGYNSFPRGLNDEVSERQERPEKYHWFEHAERNAIYNASRIGVPISGCTLYTNGVPCSDCARGVIQAGIEKVVIDKLWNFGNSDKWNESIKRSLKMFEETGVRVDYWEGELLQIEKFRRGERI